MVFYVLFSQLQKFWESNKQYFATFVVMNQSERGFEIKLVSDAIESPSAQLYALHKAPLQSGNDFKLGMMNVPIILPPSLQAPHIEAGEFKPVALAKPSEDVEMEDAAVEASSSETALINAIKTTTNATSNAPTSTGGKRMKMVKVVRTFTENGYQMTETVNEMVPCDDDDPDALPLNGETEAKKAAPATTTSTTSAKPAAPKQSNLMSFFKKAAK